MIENEQRESLKPMELALFVQRRMAAGDSQAEIARRLGKSRQYITYATALIEAPDWLLAAYREGKCRGLTELYELRKLFDQYGDTVQVWASYREAITRESVAALRAESTGVEAASEALQSDAARNVPVESEPESPPVEDTSASTSAPLSTVAPPDVKATLRTKTTRLAVELRGRPFELVLDKDPGRHGKVIVKPFKGGAHRCVQAADVKLIGFVEVDQEDPSSC